MNKSTGTENGKKSQNQSLPDRDKDLRNKAAQLLAERIWRAVSLAAEERPDRSKASPLPRIANLTTEAT